MTRPFPVRQALAPICAAGREVWRDGLATVSALLLALTGIGCIAAAGFTWLIPLFGVGGAFALTGGALLLLAVVVLLLRQSRRRVDLPQPVVGPSDPPVDPLMQIVFDLSFALGRIMSRPRK